MTKELEAKVWKTLEGVRFPGMSRDIVSFGFVSGVRVTGGEVSVELKMSTNTPDAPERVKAEVEAVLGALAGVESVVVALDLSRPGGGSGPGAAQRAVSRSADLLPEVAHVVAVASGKGGVGKSTVASNLAVSLSQLGYSVGLVDCDIYGPSLPMMFGIHDRPRVDSNRIIPFEKYGVRIMSLGFVLDVDTPVIWRGPMVMKAIEQMLGDVTWGTLDYLIVDLPPGTGDAQLTITQRVPLSGAVIVTTPQDVALIDARKGLAMFQKVNVPVVGLVENMSGFHCPHCGETTDIFKQGGGERTADLLDTPFLGRIPLDAKIVMGGDAGVPIAVEDEETFREAFHRVAVAVVDEVARRSGDRPELSIV